MDHETAVRVQAAERYVLDQFSPQERAEFEEHFFECWECADEVKAASILAANTKAVLREDAESRVTSKPRIRLFWAFAVSAALNVALLVNLGVGRRPAETVEPQFYQSFAIPPASRSAAITNKVPAGSRFFGARFDLPPGHHFTSFAYEILDRDGRSYSSRSLKPPSGENSQLELAIPVSSLKPGVYVVTLSGREQANSSEISRAQFLIQE